MITFIAHMRVSPGNAAAFEALMTEMCTLVRANEPGVLHYSFAKSVKDPDTYVAVEIYRDVAAHETHMASAWVRASIPKSTLLVENGRFDIKQYVSPGAEPVRRRQTIGNPPPAQ